MQVQAFPLLFLLQTVASQLPSCCLIDGQQPVILGRANALADAGLVIRGSVSARLCAAFLQIVWCGSTEAEVPPCLSCKSMDPIQFSFQAATYCTVYEDSWSVKS